MQKIKYILYKLTNIILMFIIFIIMGILIYKSVQNITTTTTTTTTTYLTLLMTALFTFITIRSQNINNERSYVKIILEEEKSFKSNLNDLLDIINYYYLLKEKNNNLKSWYAILFQLCETNTKHQQIENENEKLQEIKLILRNNLKKDIYDKIFNKVNFNNSLKQDSNMSFFNNSLKSVNNSFNKIYKIISRYMYQKNSKNYYALERELFSNWSANDFKNFDILLNNIMHIINEIEKISYDYSNEKLDQLIEKAEEYRNFAKNEKKYDFETLSVNNFENQLNEIKKLILKY